MRTFTVACLTMGLFLQVGCASISKMTAQRKQKASEKASAEYLAAKDLEVQGKQEKARELYEQMLAKDPKNPEYMHRLAVVCTRLQRYAEADDYFERAHQLAPKSASLLVDMGYSSYLRGDRVEAERLLREAVHLKPTDKRALNNLALVVGRQGKIEECLSLLQQAGDESSALSGLAYIHSQRGEMDLAEQRYREALEKDPKNKDAVKAIAELEKRQSQDAMIAKSTPTRTETFRLAEIPSNEFDAPVIQQVGAVAEKGTTVKTANFVEESTESNEPGLLAENHDIAKKPARKKMALAFDDEDDVVEEPVSAPVVKRTAKAQVAEWDSDDPEVPKPAKRTSLKLTDFDPDFEESEPQTQSTTAPTSPAKRLTFSPSRSSSTRSGPAKWDSAPIDTSDQAE